MKKTILLLLIYSINSFAQTKDTVAERFSKLITAEELSKHLHVLASDEYEGRETGEKGQKMAAAYIANHFKNVGIPPYKDTTYYQAYPLRIQTPEGATITNKGKNYIFLKDFYYFPGFSNTVIKADKIILAGYGISDKNYDDYAGIDINGKVVAVFEGEPLNKDKKSIISGEEKLSTWSTNWRLKSETAKNKGALALLIIVDDIEKNINKSRHFIEAPTMKLENKKKEEKTDERLPVFYISQAMAKDLIGKKPADLKEKINETGKTIIKEQKADLVINVNRNTNSITAENVLGFVEGSDLKNEVIIVTAHYDHLGKDNGVVYNGADDDGSGTVAVMQLAKAFAKAKQEGKGPRRSILFMPVSGEEKALLGSKYYTENPVYPLENTVANLNIDMIGRLDEKHPNNANYVYLIGSDKLSTELHNISEQANKIYTNIELDYTYNDINDKNRFYYRSDHYNFAKNNIPVIFYFNGTHADYHEETDEVHKINFDKIEKISKLVFFTAWELANRPERIKVDVKKN